MPIKKFRDIGLLQEVNRKFFHPLGLALEIKIERDKGEYWISGVRDYRQDPEGVRFGVDQLSEKKAEKVKALWQKKALRRKKILGYVVQPLKSELKKSRSTNTTKGGEEK